jgi:hypothetical protein
MVVIGLGHLLLLLIGLFIAGVIGTLIALYVITH